MEAEFMQKLKHPNIVLHQASFEEQQKFIILMEFCENADLEHFIE